MITSAANPRVKLVRKLESRRQREKLGLFACEGEDLVAAGLDAGLEPVEALVDAERPAIVERLAGAELVAPEVMGGLSTLAPPGPGRRGLSAGGLATLAGRGRRARALARLGSWERRHASAGGGRARAGVRRSSRPAAPTRRGRRRCGPRPARSSVCRSGASPTARASRAWRSSRVAALRSPGWISRNRLSSFSAPSGRACPRTCSRRCEISSPAIPQAEAAESLNVAVAGAIALYEWRRGRG